MTIQASHNGCDACTSQTARNGLLRTPRDYMRRARELQAVGSPFALRAMQQAAMAHAAAAAAMRGDHRLAQRALAGLHALSDGDPSQEALTRLQSSLSARASGIRAQIQAYSQLASGVANIIAAATNDPNVVKVVRWIDFILLGRSAPEQLRLNELADFCRVWNGGVGVMAIGSVRAIGGAISAGTRNPQAAQVADMLAAFVEQATTQLCALVPEQSSAPASDPGNCRDLLCSGIGELKRVRSDGTGCECYTPTPSPTGPRDLVNDAHTVWRNTMARRLLVEAVLDNARRNPPTTPSAQRIIDNAQAINCRHACALEYAELQYIAALRGAGRPANIPAFSASVPAASRARRYVNSATAPTGCRCEGSYEAPDGSGASTASPAVLVGGVAAIGLLAMFAMKK